jgi:hypothetical protein
MNAALRLRVGRLAGFPMVEMRWPNGFSGDA